MMLVLVIVIGAIVYSLFIKPTQIWEQLKEEAIEDQGQMDKWTKKNIY